MTAAQWLIAHIEKENKNGYDFHPKYNEKIIEQVKEMEKQQIENAFESGFVTQQWDKTKENKAEEYYNETFNK